MSRSQALSALALALLAALMLWLVVGEQGGGSMPAGGAASPTNSAPPSGPTPASGAAEGARGADTRDWDDVDACDDSALPRELDPVVDDIEDDGPYAYPDRDGSTFDNREDLLPQEDRGYYREFTVQTPGLSTRGARRVVTGGGVDPEVWYFTDDHYQSFCEFAPAG